MFFGKSWLGKSSISRAGASPLLRNAEFVPIYIRLNHAEEAPPLEGQVEIRQLTRFVARFLAGRVRDTPGFRSNVIESVRTAMPD